MIKITIELTDVQYKALSCIALSPEEYLQNYAIARSEQAIESVAKEEIEVYLKTGVPIPISKEKIIMSNRVVPLKKRPVDDKI